MPQVDLETLVSACAGVSCDNKITCETLASTTTTAADSQRPHDHHEGETDPPEIPPDFPPESFWLSKDAEFDWFDRNAFIERKDSTKGNSHSTNLNPSINPNSSSQRFSNLKSKASIIGLPKPQKSCFVDARRHCKPAHARLFPKRSGSVSKSDTSVNEPSSPKVSCMGRVRSKKDRNRRLKNRQRSKRSSESEHSKKEKHDRKQRGGFFASFRAIFTGNKNRKNSSLCGNDSSLKDNNSSLNGKDSSRTKSSKTTTVKTSDIRDRLPKRERDASPIEQEAAGSGGGVEPVGLGGMKRFASGRKSESWIDVA